jgi:hypothetical protein
LPIGVLNPIPYHPIWGDDALRYVEKEKFIIVGLSKYVEFWKSGIEKSTTYAIKMISFMNIGKIFYWICQNYCLFKVLLLWRALGLQAIEGLIMLKLCTLPSTMKVVDLEDPIMHHYCGPNNLKPSPTIHPI